MHRRVIWHLGGKIVLESTRMVVVSPLPCGAAEAQHLESEEVQAKTFYCRNFPKFSRYLRANPSPPFYCLYTNASDCDLTHFGQKLHDKSVPNSFAPRGSVSRVNIAGPSSLDRPNQQAPVSPPLSRSNRVMD